MRDPNNFLPVRWGFPILFNKEKDRNNIMKILNENQQSVDLDFTV